MGDAVAARSARTMATALASVSRIATASTTTTTTTTTTDPPRLVRAGASLAVVSLFTKRLGSALAYPSPSAPRLPPLGKEGEVAKDQRGADAVDALLVLASLATGDAAVLEQRKQRQKAREKEQQRGGKSKKSGKKKLLLQQQQAEVTLS